MPAQRSPRIPARNTATLPKKPEKGGRPASAKAATPKPTALSVISAEAGQFLTQVPRSASMHVRGPASAKAAIDAIAD